MNSPQQSSNRKMILQKYFKKLRCIHYVLLSLFSIIVIVCLLVALYSLKLIGNHSKSPLLRQTTHGPVEGVVLTSSLGQKYYAFRGIPFAEPPITGIDPYTGEKVDRRFKVRTANIGFDIFLHIFNQMKFSFVCRFPNL